MNQFKKYILLWLTQSVSQLCSAMSGFALTLWAYSLAQTPMTFSLMAFCSYMPYVLVSLFAGAFVDCHNKKSIMLVSDSLAAVCTMIMLILSLTGRLMLWHIYVVNGVIGVMNAFQQPASAVAIGKIVPKDKLSNVSGMNSFSGDLVTVLSPVLAASLFAAGGLGTVLLIDLLSFFGAFIVLLLVIHIPEETISAQQTRETVSAFAGAKEGYAFLLRQNGLLSVMLTMALINFFSRLTYENVLSPMILARSENSSLVLGLVNTMMGVGGIIGGLIVSVMKPCKNNVRMMYVSAAFSFLLGDFLMAIGRNCFVWCIAGFAASFPIPFIMAGNNVIMYSRVPQEMQGRVFAVRNAIQFGTVPVGILLGGMLATYIFEPFMCSDSVWVGLLDALVGTGAGSGMALMFLCTSIGGFAVSCAAYQNRNIRSLDQ